MRYLILILLLTSCVKEDKPIQEPVQALTMALLPCDSVYFIPVFSGSMMKILPKTIVPWTRSGKTFWFTKGYAFSVVNPFNYQQDSAPKSVWYSATQSKLNTQTHFISAESTLNEINT
jgi:hypothetical protein